MITPRLPAATIALMFAALVAGCRLLPPDYTIHVSNASTLRLTIVVNGQAVGDLAPDSMADYPPDRLPARPWAVAAQMADGGRVVAAMTVEEGAIQDDRASPSPAGRCGCGSGSRAVVGP